MTHEPLVEWDGGLDTFDDVLVQCPLHFGDGLLTGLCDHNELGNHAVIMRGDTIASVYVGVDSDAVTTRSVVVCDCVFHNTMI